VPGEIAQLQCLFAWITYCEDGYLSLGAARCLLRLTQHWDPLVDTNERNRQVDTADTADFTGHRWRPFVEAEQRSQHEAIADAANDIGLASAERFDEEFERNLSR
jgi:hypothetical protein